MDETHLDIGLRLVRHLHDELGFTLDHVLENGLVDPFRPDKYPWGEEFNNHDLHGAQVVRVGNKKVFFALGDELIQYTTVQ